MFVAILTPAAVFTAIVLALSGFVLAARRRLEPSGIVPVTVNGSRTLELAASTPLLWALAERDVFLPAACGGRGACGQCRVTVTAGAPPPRPTEQAALGAEELAAGMRLACLLKLRVPLEIVVPEAVLDVQKLGVAVRSTRSVATYLKEVVLELRPEQRLEFTAGQYVLLEAPPGRIAFRDFELDAPLRHEWRRQGLLELTSKSRDTVVRAYSIASAPHESDRVVLVVRIATPPAEAPGAPPGRVSSYVFGLKPGDSVTISGPFGEFRASETKREMLFIGGGAGIAPLRSIIRDQLERDTGRKLSLWYGVRDELDLAYADEFRELAARHASFDFHVALSSPRDASWDGPTGFIHRVVHEQYLSRHAAPRDVEYYLCGPPLMTAAVTQMLDELGVARENVFFDDFGS